MIAIDFHTRERIVDIIKSNKRSDVGYDILKGTEFEDKYNLEDVIEVCKMEKYRIGLDDNVTDNRLLILNNQTVSPPAKPGAKIRRKGICH